MNKRQAKKYLRRPRRQPFNVNIDKQSPQEREAWRKARGKWSPWRMRSIKMTFTIYKDDLKPGTIEQNIIDDLHAQEDARILDELGRMVEASKNSPFAWGLPRLPDLHARERARLDVQATDPRRDHRARPCRGGEG